MSTTIDDLMKNASIMKFVINEAREKVAFEIRAKTGSGTTANAVKLIELRNDNVRAVVQQYVAAGVVGVHAAIVELRDSLLEKGE